MTTTPTTPKRTSRTAPSISSPSSAPHPLVPPPEIPVGRLNPEASGKALHKDWIEQRALDPEVGTFLAWEDLAAIFQYVKCFAGSPGMRDIREALVRLIEAFPYDERAWNEQQSFIPRRYRQTTSGKTVPPRILIHLVVEPVDEEE